MYGIDKVSFSPCCIKTNSGKKKDSKDALKAYALEYALNISKDSITAPSVLLLMLPWILTAIYNGSSVTFFKDFLIIPPIVGGKTGN